MGSLFSLFFFACHYLQNATVDDVFISFRYAKNLATGGGLVYNLGDRVEGYSNFLWVCLLALAYKIGWMPPFFSKIASGFWGLLTLWLLGWLGARFLKSKEDRYQFLPAMSVFMAATSYPFVYWSITGMETSLFAFLLLLSLVAQSHDIDSNSRFPAASLIFIALALCRAEGIAFYLFSLIPKFISHRNTPVKTNVRKYLWEGLLVLSAFGIFLLFRYFYYGELLPNTYYAKIGGGQWRVGLAYLYGFIEKYYLLILLAILGLSLPVSNQSFLRNLMVVYLLGYTCLIVFIGGDWMWHFRLFVPLLPLLWLSCGRVFVHLFDRIGRQVKLPALTYSFVVLLFLSALYPMRGTFLRGSDWLEALSFKVKSRDFCLEALIAETHKNLALYLERKNPGNVSVAVNHIGAFGYYANFTILDMTGLVDRHIARDPRKKFHDKYDADYILSKKPDYVILTTRTMPRSTYFKSDYWAGETALYNHALFKKHYIQRPENWEYTFSGQPEYLAVFEKKP